MTMNPWSHVQPVDANPQGDPADAGPLRYERGGRVFAADGSVGTLRQVVVDDERGEVTMLVVQPENGAEPVVVPVDLIDRGAGSAIFLRVTREQFALGSNRSPRYERQQFVAADLRKLARTAAAAMTTDKLRRIARVTRDALDTSPAEHGQSVPAMARARRVSTPRAAAVAATGAD